MANKQTSIVPSGTNNYLTPSISLNRIATDTISPGVIGAITPGVGVTFGTYPVTGGALSVQQQGSPNMSVQVAGPGVGYVSATPTGGTAQTLGVTVDVNENVTINANVSGSTVYDFVYLQLDPLKLNNPASNGLDVASFITVRSTTPWVNTAPYYGQSQTGAVANTLLLGVVTVVNGASSIANANITDARVQAGSLLVLPASAITLGYAQITTGFSTVSTTQVQATGLSVTVAIPAGGRRVKITAFSPYIYSTAVAFLNFFIWDGAVGSGTNISGSQVYAPVTTGGAPATAISVILPAAGSKTYNIGFNTSAGTGTLQANTTQPAFILVEAI
jgi:hypothetical protein